MKKYIWILLVLITGELYAQQQQEFTPAPISAYGNTLHYHYSQSQWYYRYLIENEYSLNSFNKTTNDLLDVMVKVKPKVDTTKSILDVYREEYKKSLYRKSN